MGQRLLCDSWGLTGVRSSERSEPRRGSSVAPSCGGARFRRSLAEGSALIVARDDIRRNGCLPANVLTKCCRTVTVCLWGLLDSLAVVYPAEFRTRRLVVREMALDDAVGLLPITSDPAVVRHLTFGPTSDVEVRGLVDFAMASARSEPRTDYALAVVASESGALVGSCGLELDADAPRSAEVYFVLAQGSWGRGFGTELLGALLAFGFERVGLRRIHGVAHPENVASVRVMQKNGMVYEGDAEAAFEDAGGWRDGARYAILQS